jgi:hypothetical protein
VNFKNQVNKRLRADAEHSAAQAKAKELEPKLKSALKAARAAEDKLSKDRFNPDLKSEYQRTRKEATALRTEYERHMSTMRRIARREERALAAEQTKVANKAMLEARRNEPSVNGQKLGDADWETSPRD